MPDCPRCHQPVESQAIVCPHCQTVLKAYGHPGMTLFRANGTEPLCKTCTYHADDTCNFPQRPTAKECTLYHDRTQTLVAAQHSSPSFNYGNWVKRNLFWLVLLGIVVISLLVAIL